MRELCKTQGTREWEIARKGRITASAIGHVLAGRGTKSRDRYRMELILDLEGVDDFADTAKWFVHGRQYEQHALGWYNFHKQELEQTGFVLHDEYNWLGASPDGLVTADGMVEAKCRATLHAFEEANTKPIPRLYASQMQAGMWVCNRQWCDYLNYWRDDKTGKEQAHVRRIERDEGRIRELEDAALIFWKETIVEYCARNRCETYTFPWDIWQERKRQIEERQSGNTYRV